MVLLYGVPVTRALFTNEGTISKEAAYTLIDSVKPGALFYKVVLSPDPRREDTRRDLNLWQLTRQTAATLTLTLNREIRFIAVEHNDHTDIRHVHAIFLIPGRLSRQEFRLLAQTARQSATKEARLQRKARDLTLQNPRTPFLTDSRSVKSSRQSREARAPKVQAGCYSCGYGMLTGIPVFYTYCPSCHVRLREKQQKRLRLRWEVEA